MFLILAVENHRTGTPIPIIQLILEQKLVREGNFLAYGLFLFYPEGHNFRRDDKSSS